MSGREELFQLMLGRTTTKAVERILAAGYRKTEPKWAETLVNDGTYEYTVSSDCDGSSVVHWRRKPAVVAIEDAAPWEPYEPEAS
jgi:hypothetical protein